MGKNRQWVKALNFKGIGREMREFSHDGRKETLPYPCPSCINPCNSRGCADGMDGYIWHGGCFLRLAMQSKFHHALVTLPLSLECEVGEMTLRRGHARQSISHSMSLSLFGVLPDCIVRLRSHRVIFGGRFTVKQKQTNKAKQSKTKHVK